MKPSKSYSFISLLFILTVFDHPKATLSSFTAREDRRAVLAGLRIIHLLFRRQERTLRLYHKSPTQATRVNPSLAIMFAGLLLKYGAGNFLSLPTGFVIALLVESPFHRSQGASL